MGSLPLTGPCIKFCEIVELAPCMHGSYGLIHVLFSPTLYFPVSSWTSLHQPFDSLLWVGLGYAWSAQVRNIRFQYDMQTTWWMMNMSVCGWWVCEGKVAAVHCNYCGWPWGRVEYPFSPHAYSVSPMRCFCFQFNSITIIAISQYSKWKQTLLWVTLG